MITAAENEKIYDLNLSERYVPNWGAWEIGREVISNAIDADPNGYEVEIHNPDFISVKTKTVPTIAQLKIIGAGTKDTSGDTIGHFGEGFKLAALACTRAGGQITVLAPTFVASFALDEAEGERVLIMKVKPPMTPYSDCEIMIGIPGIAAAIDGRFLKDRQRGPREKREPDAMHVFVRGVHVQRIEQKSLFDWNIYDVQINRDRSMINEWCIAREAAAWLDRNMNEELAVKLINADSGTFELETMEKWPEYFNRPSRAHLVSALKKKHGANIIVGTQNASANKLAAAKGNTVLVLDQGLAKVIKPTIKGGEGVLDSEDLIQSGRALRNVPAQAEWREAISEIEQIIDLIEIPAEIMIFQDFEMAELGLAVLRPERDGCTLWLNEKLFLPGYRRERVSTAIHELGHIRDKAGDGTIEFEKSLDTIAGIIALAWLDGKK